MRASPSSICAPASIKVTARRARVVEAEPIDPGAVIELDVDGENPGRLPARFEIVPAALWLVAPGGQPAS